jgi:hypothetical protein
MNDDLNKMYSYQAGHLYWKANRCKSRIGKKAGHIRPDGRIDVRVKGKLVRAHIVIWRMLVGEIPEGFIIDHKNRNPSDNRIENLRLLTNQENTLNRDARGCYWNGHSWRARIKAYGKHIELGAYGTEEEARSAYLKYKGQLLDGSFDRLYWCDPNSEELRWK